MGIDVFCRKTDKNVSRKEFEQAPPLPKASVVFDIQLHCFSVHP
jgi:hypothetical protein